MFYQYWFFRSKFNVFVDFPYSWFSVDFVDIAILISMFVWYFLDFVDIDQHVCWLSTACLLIRVYFRVYFRSWTAGILTMTAWPTRGSMICSAALIGESCINDAFTLISWLENHEFVLNNDDFQRRFGVYWRCGGAIFGHCRLIFCWLCQYWPIFVDFIVDFLLILVEPVGSAGARGAARY